MQRVHAMIGLAALMGAAMVASPALAVTAYSPTGNLNVRSAITTASCFKRTWDRIPEKLPGK